MIKRSRCLLQTLVARSLFIIRINSSGMTNTLRVQHLYKKYKSREVVKDVSVHINRGEVVGLLGPNGAGKTTSFYMIVGLIPVDGGTIQIDDKDITNLPVHARAQLGISYLPQEA